MKEKLEKWHDSLDAIEKEVSSLYFYYHIFHEVRLIVDANPSIQKPSYFYEFLRMSYTTFMACGVRRMVKHHSDSISIKGFLEDLLRNADLLTREGYVALYKPVGEHPCVSERANSDFDSIAGKGQSTISKDSIHSDLESLKLIGKICEDFVDKRVAHRDRRHPSSIPKDKDFQAALDEFERIVQRYLLILRATHSGELLPHDIPETWKDIFREPWLPESGDGGKS